jgi:hypothetical protein
MAAIVGHHGSMVAIAWALFALLAAVLGVLTACFPAGLGRIDSMSARIDGLGARIDAQSARMD